jgi:UDP-glucose 4-epimerase
MHYFITGAAGFIGSHLTDALLAAGHRVTGYDNLSTGTTRFLESALLSERFTLLEADLLDTASLNAAMRGADMVFHLAANADVRFGTQHPARDLEQNTLATFNVLEAMRANEVKRIAFASTGSVYGEPQVFPTPEDAPFPVQTSLYAASKVAGEGLISAYAEGFSMQAHIFRFVSILGPRYTHGHIFDFYKQLKADSSRLHILGNGKQRKSYLHVADCVRAMLHACTLTDAKLRIFNLGTDEYVEVNDSVAVIASELGVSPELSYGGGERGWVGDSPFIFLDTKRIRATGWQPSFAIRDAVRDTVRWIRANEWVLEVRA